MQLPSVGRETFEQGIHGQVSRKPTTFLTLRLQMRQILRYPQCHFEKVALEPLGGLNAKGQFKTAIAKEYPRSLNIAIARSVLKTFKCSRTTGEGDDMLQDASLQSAIEALTTIHDEYSDIAELSYGPDYNQASRLLSH